MKYTGPEKQVHMPVDTEQDVRILENTAKALKKRGFFSHDGETYVLTSPETPRPWQHVLSNEEYLLVLSQWGGGYSAYRTIHTNTVTRKTWPKEDAGRFFYVRNAETGETWSPTLWPVHTSAARCADYKCIYASGHMTWETTFGPIKSRLTAVVAKDDPTEIYVLELENRGTNSVALDIFAYVEWVFEGAPIEEGAALKSSFEEGWNCQVAELALPPKYRAKQTGFLTSDRRIVSFDGSRDSFLGSPGSVAEPLAVRRGQCGNKPGPIIGDSCGAIHTRVRIAPDSIETIHFVLGITDSQSGVPALRRKYCDEATVKNELARVKKYWSQRLRGFELAGSDRATLDFANHWLKYQVVQNCRWTRWGSDKGYRDVLQDAAGMRLIDPTASRTMILDMAAVLRSDGHAPRQRSITPWRDHDWRDYRDSGLWLVFALEKYIKETGAFGILKEDVPFCDDAQGDSLYAHADRAMEFLWNSRGQHGLCLIGQGDWLDSLNAAGVGGKGESVWLTQAACYALREMERIATLIGKESDSRRYHAWRADLSDVVNTAGWDGDWYLMAYDDWGRPIGSQTCQDGGKIFLAPQAWGVLSGTADRDRAERALAAADDKLLSAFGYLIFAPMYSAYDENVGRISLWSSEGASVYCHAVAFKIAADLVMGRGDAAWNALQSITPASGAVDLTASGAEPFCYVNSFAGEDWPQPGRSYTGWWTGTTSWAAQMLVEWIFGARADYDGLLVDPCLPSSWTNASVVRPFRGNTYDVVIKKPRGICKSRVQLTVDGIPVNGNLLSYPSEGRRYHVLCEIS